MSITAEMRRLIGAGAAAEDVEALARRAGAASLESNALQLAAQGRTSLEEVARVARERA